MYSPILMGGVLFIKQESELLFKSMENIITKFLKSVSYDKEGVVISSEDNICIVEINKQKYKIKNGINVTFSAGDKCLVHYINGSKQNKIIIAKL